MGKQINICGYGACVGITVSCGFNIRKYVIFVLSTINPAFNYQLVLYMYRVHLGIRLR